MKFCNDAMVTFSDTYSFIPDTEVIITCSLSESSMLWRSSVFPDVSLTAAGTSTESRLDGAIIFQRVKLVTSPLCLTITATIGNIQESMKGLDLTCSNAFGTVSSNLIIDIIGKHILWTSVSHLLIL